MTFTETMADPPANLSLRARLAWEYFFGSSCGGWAVIQTGDNCWITVDEGCDLNTATVYPDEDAFLSWLETVCSAHLNDDPVGFLSCFCSLPELVTESVAMEIAKILASE